MPAASLDRFGYAAAIPSATTDARAIPRTPGAAAPGADSSSAHQPAPRGEAEARNATLRGVGGGANRPAPPAVPGPWGLRRCSDRAPAQRAAADVPASTLRYSDKSA